MTRTMPTLTDVARHAGVSEITVSRVVRSKGPTATHTRAKVLDSVLALGYIPNRAAGSLASSGSMLVGVLLPSLSNNVFPEVLSGIHTALAPTLYQPMIGVTDYNPLVEEKLVLSLLAWQPAAIILTGFDHTPATCRHLAASGVRVAEVMDIDASPIDLAVGLSHRRAGYDTGVHLIKRGYRRFAYVGHDWDKDRRARFRFEGLVSALSEAGLTLAAELRHDGPSSTAAGRAAFAELYRVNPLVDVIVFSNDDMAIGGYFHCMADGIAIREQVALFGFNGLDIGQALPQPLSTVRSNRYLIGKIVTEMLLDRLDRPVEKMVIDTGYDIIEGATA